MLPCSHLQQSRRRRTGTDRCEGHLSLPHPIPFLHWCPIPFHPAAPDSVPRHIPEVPPSQTPYRSTDISSSGSHCQSGWHHHSTDTYIPVYFPYSCSPSLSFLQIPKGRCLSTAAYPSGQWLGSLFSFLTIVKTLLPASFYHHPADYMQTSLQLFSPA